MVKIRGNRVELDEVEAALASHAAVSEPAAYAVSDGRGSKAVRATVNLHEAESVASTELRQHTRERIPSYAIPEEIDIADDLPRTSSGKIDRKRLSEQHSGTRDA